MLLYFVWMADFLPTTIYLLRHGRFVNPKQVVKARLPGFPLSDIGREEIKEIAKFLAEKDVSTVYYSPLLRTKQTARIIASYNGAELKACSSLLETDTSFVGRPIASKLRTREFYAKYYEDPLHVLARMRRALRRMIQDNFGSTVVAVSHGGPIDVLKAHLQGVRDENIHPGGSFGYGGILILKLDRNLRLLEEPRVLRVGSREV